MATAADIRITPNAVYINGQDVLVAAESIAVSELHPNTVATVTLTLIVGKLTVETDLNR